MSVSAPESFRPGSQGDLVGCGGLEPGAGQGAVVVAGQAADPDGRFGGSGDGHGQLLSVGMTSRSHPVPPPAVLLLQDLAGLGEGHRGLRVQTRQQLTQGLTDRDAQQHQHPRAGARSLRRLQRLDRWKRPWNRRSSSEPRPHSYLRARQRSHVAALGADGRAFAQTDLLRGYARHPGAYFQR